MLHFASYFLAQQLICCVHVCIFFHRRKNTYLSEHYALLSTRFLS
jgi:hypothetical protein